MSRIFARVFQDTNYAGQYRWIRDDVRNFVNDIGFNDLVSSIVVYRGNDYQAGDTIRFHENVNFDGGYLDLGPGYYPNIHVQPFSFGDRISSANILPAPNPQSGLGVRLMVRIYENVDYGGQYRDILLSEGNLSNVGFNDKVSSVRIFAGEDYSPGWVCDFFQHADYAGGVLQPGRFGPGTNIPNIVASPYSFNDVISSVKMYQAT